MPNHTTIAAYLALFCALATGGAYAAERIGTKDLKRDAVTSPKIKAGAIHADELREPVVRVATRQADSADPMTPLSVEARCKKNERFISGGGGWSGRGTIRFAGPNTDERPPARATGYVVRGETAEAFNQLEARVICLRR